MLEGKQAQHAPAMPRGLYMHGGVGTGKTMLMDLFVYSAPPHYQAWPRSPLGLSSRRELLAKGFESQKC